MTSTETNPSNPKNVSMLEVYRHYNGACYIVIGLTRYCGGDPNLNDVRMVSYAKVDESILKKDSYGKIAIMLDILANEKIGRYSQEESRFLELIFVKKGVNNFCVSTPRFQIIQ